MNQTRGEVVYLDHAATAWPKAAGVGEAMARALERGSAGRGGYGLARSAMGDVQAVRTRVAGLIGERDASRLVFTAGCTDAIHQSIVGVLSACVREQPGAVPEVVVSGVEHNAVSRTVAALAKAGRLRMVEASADVGTRVGMDRVLAVCSERTRLVCVVHASNVTGMIQPIEAIGSALRERHPDALLLVDGAQTVGTMPVDVRSLRADLLAFGAHKGLRGPSGIGGLWIGERVWGDGLRRIDPVRQGGTGTASDGDAMPDLLPLAMEAGTLNLPGIAGLGAAAEAHDAGAIIRGRAMARDLLESLHAHLGERVVVYGHERGSDFADAVPTIALNVRGWQAGDLAEVLDASFGIAVRAGLHCSPRGHRAMGTLQQGGCLRVSLGSTTTEDDTRRFVDALAAVTGR